MAALLGLAALALVTAVPPPPPPPPAPDCAGTTCGCTQPALSTSAKNVLLVGDSISMPSPPSPGGYGLIVKALLENASYTNGTAVSVWHNGGWGNGGQASSTRKGMNCTSNVTAGNWLDFSGTLDVVHFNFGLHDLVDPRSTEGPEAVNLTVYNGFLQQIYARFSARAKHVIWATTTPCPAACGGKGRSDTAVQLYNKEALKALTAAASSAGKTLLVDDLYGAVEQSCGAHYKSCGLQIKNNVHFSPAGREFLGQHVSKSILEALGDDRQ